MSTNKILEHFAGDDYTPVGADRLMNMADVDQRREEVEAEMGKTISRYSFKLKNSALIDVVATSLKKAIAQVPEEFRSEIAGWKLRPLSTMTYGMRA